MCVLWDMPRLDRLSMKSSLRFIAVNLALLAVLNTAAWGADGGIHFWLEKMQHAAHTVNYDGTFVYSRKVN